MTSEEMTIVADLNSYVVNLKMYL